MATIKKDERIDGVRYLTIPIRDNLDDAGITALIEQLAPPVVGIVGNLADVHRGGASVVTEGGSVSDGVEVPPGVTDADIATTKAVADAVQNAIDTSTGTANSAGDAHTGAASK
jgi:hypothetical protein